MAGDVKGYDGAVNGVEIVHGVAIVRQQMSAGLSQQLTELKFSVHRKLLDLINLEALSRLSGNERIWRDIRGLIAKLLDEEPTFLTPAERDRIIGEVLDEVFGLDPSKSLPPLSPVARESVVERAIGIIGNAEDAMRWLGTPIRALDNATPISRLHNPTGKDEVLAVLEQLEHGVL
jgi:hypothetical protein